MEPYIVVLGETQEYPDFYELPIRNPNSLIPLRIRHLYF